MHKDPQVRMGTIVIFQFIGFVVLLNILHALLAR
jgi:hypothetical protein